MNVFPLPLLVLLVALSSINAHAADVPRSDADCRKILDSWSKDVKSVPKRLVDQCKEQIANIAPAAGLAAAAQEPQAAAVDPCSGPDAAGSVLCWGPWTALAPAAEGIVAPPAIVVTEPINQRPELGGPYTPGIIEPLLYPSCAAGASCGFATVVSGVTSDGPVDETQITPFGMASDGSQFTVYPAGPAIHSVTGMTTYYVARPDQYQELVARGRGGDQGSRLVARTIVNGNGVIEQAADVWTDGNFATRVANSGYFAWGTTTTQDALNSLNAGAVTATYSGPMSVDNHTIAQITVNFGAQPGWTGTWNNPGYSFGAGGNVSGIDFVSNPAQFTSNVQAGSYVQGILLGQPGNLGIAHAIDVTLSGAGHIKDVGLLREVVSQPGGSGIARP